MSLRLHLGGNRLGIPPFLLVIFLVTSALAVLPNKQMPTDASPLSGDNPTDYAFLEWQDEAMWAPWGLGISDVDLDGYQELVVDNSGQGPWDLRIYNGSSHEYLLEAKVSPNQWHHTVSAGNVNDDPLEEIIIPSWEAPGAKDTLCIFQWDGSSLAKIWSSGYLLPETQKAEMFDVDDDGKQEIFTLSVDYPPPKGLPVGHLFEIDFNSTSDTFDVRDLWSLPGEVLTQIKFYDIDEDGVQEIVLRSWLGIHALDSKSMTLDWSLNNSELPYVGGFLGMDVGDPDNDGRAEVVVSGNFEQEWRIVWIDVQTKSIERLTPPGLTWHSERLEIYDVDQDSVAEVVAPIALDWVNGTGGYLIVLDGRTGDLEFRSRNYGDSLWVGYSMCTVEVGNMDMDPEIEILIANYEDIYQYQVNVSALLIPILSYSPASLDFGTLTVGINESKTFRIWNSGNGTLTYGVTESIPWADVNPLNGSSTGEHDVINVTIDTTGLSEGVHESSILIASNGGNGTTNLSVEVLAPSLSLTLDIDPDTLNLKSKGRWITAYLSAENASVCDIDISSILLQDTLVPERWDYQDDVLILKFNRQEFKDTVQVGGLVEIKITGKWEDGTDFEAYDHIRVINPGI